MTDSCYYVAGWARDSAFGCQVSLLWAKIDRQGNVLNHTLHSEPITITESWQPTLHTDVDGNLIIGADMIDTVIERALILKWDTDGNVLWKKKHVNLFPVLDTFVFPNVLDSLTRTDDFIIAPDSSYILAGATYNGWQLTHFNRDWSIRWVRYTDCKWNFCFEHSILKEDDGFVVGYYNGDANVTPINRTMRCILEKYDYAGNLLWTWANDSSQLINGVNHLIKTKDGGYLLGTADGLEIPDFGGGTSRMAFDCLVFKLDSARNMLWQRPLRANSYSVSARVERLIELEDSTIMAFAITPDTFWSVSENRWRYQYNLLVAHISPDGDSLWSNQYYYFNEQSYASHFIYDVERTFDSGYLCVGEAKGTDGQGGAYQQGWLLKLDSMGCLVPGCRGRVMNTVEQLDEPEANLLLYPNPVTDYLSVHFTYPIQGKRLTWRIINAQGQVVQEHQSPATSNQTYIFETTGLFAGWYTLQVVQDGVPSGREAFIKQ